LLAGTTGFAPCLAGAFRHGDLDDGSRQGPEAAMKRRLKKKIKSIKVDTDNIKKDRQFWV
jgi:hypothetical protein